MAAVALIAGLKQKVSHERIPRTQENLWYGSTSPQRSAQKSYGEGCGTFFSFATSKSLYASRPKMRAYSSSEI